MKLQQQSGIEPDYCFYIDNWQAVSGKKRIDWAVEPAPDLVIEIDITSYTDVNDYLAYQAPEVWLFKSDRVTIYGLESDRYIVKERSRYLTSFAVLDLVNDCFEDANRSNTSRGIRQLRQRLKSY